MEPRTRLIFVICLQVIIEVNSFTIPLQSIITKFEPITTKRQANEEFYSNSVILDNYNAYDLSQTIVVEPSLFVKSLDPIDNNVQRNVPNFIYDSQILDDSELVIDLLPEAKSDLNDNCGTNYYDAFYPDYDYYSTHVEPILTVNPQIGILTPIIEVNPSQYVSSYELSPVSNNFDSYEPFYAIPSSEHPQFLNSFDPKLNYQPEIYLLPNLLPSELDVMSVFDSPIESLNYNTNPYVSPLSTFEVTSPFEPSNVHFEPGLAPSFRDLSENQFVIPLEAYQFYPDDNLNMKREICNDYPYLVSVDPYFSPPLHDEYFVPSPTMLTNPSIYPSPVDSIQSAVSFLDSYQFPTSPVYNDLTPGFNLPLTSSFSVSSSVFTPLDFVDNYFTPTPNLPMYDLQSILPSVPSPNFASSPIPSFSVPLSNPYSGCNKYPLPTLTLSNALAKYFDEARSVSGKLNEFIANFNTRASLASTVRSPRLCEPLVPLSVSPFEVPSISISSSETLLIPLNENLFSAPKVPLQNDYSPFYSTPNNYQETLSALSYNNYFPSLDSTYSAFLSSSPYNLVPTDPYSSLPAPVVPKTTFVTFEKTESGILLADIMSSISVKGPPSALYSRNPIPYLSSVSLNMPFDLLSSQSFSSPLSSSPVYDGYCDSCHEEIDRLVGLIEMQLAANRV